MYFGSFGDDYSVKLQFNPGGGSTGGGCMEPNYEDSIFLFMQQKYPKAFQGLTIGAGMQMTWDQIYVAIADSFRSNGYLGKDPSSVVPTANNLAAIFAVATYAQDCASQIKMFNAISPDIVAAAQRGTKPAGLVFSKINSMMYQLPVHMNKTGPRVGGQSSQPVLPPPSDSGIPTFALVAGGVLAIGIAGFILLK